MTVQPRPGDTTVNVALGDRAYDIVIGRRLLSSLGGRIGELRKGAKAIVVADQYVGERYLPDVTASLRQSGIPHTTLLVPRGETSKSFSEFERVCEAIIDARIERGDLVIALGGGVIGDLVGFAAACVRRGVDYVQVPTTLVAQVDSSIGGKTAINSKQGKNLIGSFHQPALVVADTAVLDSLPRRVFANGYAEVAKYGLLGDADFFSWLEASWKEIFSGGSAREQAIATCCRMKAAIVQRDEFETGERALLNLGHTFGHALETATGFSDRLFHGEGVAIGTALAFAYSARLGLISTSESERVSAHLSDVGLPTKPLDIVGARPDPDMLMELMLQDKKVKRGKLTLILVRGVGKAYVENSVDPADVREFLTGQLR